MKADNEGLQPLSSAVLNRAASEAEQTLAEAVGKAERLREEPHEKAESARREILEPAEREAKHIRQQAAVTAQIEAQRLRLQHREKRLEDVFEAAGGQLPSVRQRSDYSAVVRWLTREALKSLNLQAARIRADAQAHLLLEGGILEELAGSLGVDLELGPVLEDRTGVIVETLDGHRLYDNTLEARLERKKDALRGPVYRLLTGDKEG